MANARVMEEILAVSQRADERVLKLEAAHLINWKGLERWQDERISIANQKANNTEVAAEVRVSVRETRLRNRGPMRNLYYRAEPLAATNLPDPAVD